MRRQIARVVVGQRELVERLLIGLLCDGHVLVEGAPGLAKTLTIRTLARSLDLRFGRIQFTPDLLPADLLGTQIYRPSAATFEVHRGPIFANVVLADEINRAPAKVQSALLEAMEERQVTIGDESFPLPRPFLVLATQNPIEQEGTYPLPEAQADRFLLKVHVDYPSRDEEHEILARAGAPTPDLSPVADAAALQDCKVALTAVHIDPVVTGYVVDLVRATRSGDPRVRHGASPRGALALSASARAHAFLGGRPFVTPDDVKALAPDALRHRVGLTWEAEADGTTPDDVIAGVLGRVPPP